VHTILLSLLHYSSIYYKGSSKTFCTFTVLKKMESMGGVWGNVASQQGKPDDLAISMNMLQSSEHGSET
jgi:hypothetical protein